MKVIINPHRVCIGSYFFATYSGSMFDTPAIGQVVYTMMFMFGMFVLLTAEGM